MKHSSFSFCGLLSACERVQANVICKSNTIYSNRKRTSAQFALNETFTHFAKECILIIVIFLPFFSLARYLLHVCMRVWLSVSVTIPKSITFRVIYWFLFSLSLSISLTHTPIAFLALNKTNVSFICCCHTSKTTEKQRKDTFNIGATRHTAMRCAWSKLEKYITYAIAYK